MDGNNDFRYNLYGGMYSRVQIPPTLIGVNGEGDTTNTGAGPLQTLASVTVSGSGYNAQCVGVTAAALPASFVATQWVTVAGTNGSGGAVATDGTVQITSVNTGANSFTYTCPGASGGPAVTGTAGTSLGNAIFQAISAYSNGFNGVPWEFVGTGVGTGNVSISPYQESTAGCPAGTGFVFGQEIFAFVTANNCNGNPSVISSGRFAGTAIAGGNGALSMIANVTTLQNNSYAEGPLSFSLVSGQTTGGTGSVGSAFTGQSIFRTCAGNSNTCDYTLGEQPGGLFWIQNLLGIGATQDNRYVFASYPCDNRGAGCLGQDFITMNAPDSAGLMRFQYQTSNVGHSPAGTVDFFGYNVQGRTTIAIPAGVGTPGISASGTQVISGCSLATPVGGTWAGSFHSGVAGTCTVTITPGFTAAHGFSCWSHDLTTPANNYYQTAYTATTATLSGTTVLADLITWGCAAF
jgi:hypothetical protein